VSIGSTSKKKETATPSVKKCVNECKKKTKTLSINKPQQQEEYRQSKSQEEPRRAKQNQGIEQPSEQSSEQPSEQPREQSSEQPSEQPREQVNN